VKKDEIVTCLIRVVRDNFLTRNYPQSTGEVQRTVRHRCGKSTGQVRVIEIDQNHLKGITSQIRLRGLPYYVIPCHIIPRHIVSYHAMSNHDISCHVTSHITVTGQDRRSVQRYLVEP
jgi:hypothetical protein